MFLREPGTAVVLEKSSTLTGSGEFPQRLRSLFYQFPLRNTAIADVLHDDFGRLHLSNAGARRLISALFDGYKSLLLREPRFPQHLAQAVVFLRQLENPVRYDDPLLMRHDEHRNSMLLFFQQYKTA